MSFDMTDKRDLRLLAQLLAELQRQNVLFALKRFDNQAEVQVFPGG